MTIIQKILLSLSYLTLITVCAQAQNCEWEFSDADTAEIKRLVMMKASQFDSLFNNTYLSEHTADNLKKAYQQKLFDLFENSDSSLIENDIAKSHIVSYAKSYLNIIAPTYCVNNNYKIKWDNINLFGIFLDNGKLKASLNFDALYLSQDSGKVMRQQKREVIMSLDKKLGTWQAHIHRINDYREFEILYERTYTALTVRAPKVRLHPEKKKPIYKAGTDSLVYQWKDSICPNPVRVELWHVSKHEKRKDVESFYDIIKDELAENTAHWQIPPHIPNGYYQLSITGLNNKSARATTEIFQIKAPDTIPPRPICELQVLSNLQIESEDKIVSKSKMRITWESKMVDNIIILLCKGKKNKVVSKITPYNPANKQYYEWELPDAIKKGRYKIRIESLSCPSVYQVSNTFEIVKSKNTSFFNFFKR
ncbi:MAG: hypothetical protein JJT94_05440 [Bernardetiaceae bacterium]|nr:hypothetical protein [Bernardetiaceae bacterium]